MQQEQVIIQRGIPEQQRTAAAHLYAEAFGNKFIYLLGDTDVVANLLENELNLNMALAALNHQYELLGICGFQLGNQSFTNISVQSMVKLFGVFRGLSQSALMAVLLHRAPKNKQQLLMDGIAVHRDYRGKGIGRQLLRELEFLAKAEGKNSIRLDVIDQNAKAKRLYEQIGFSAQKHEKIPSLFTRWMGFSGATQMVKYLNP